jgi:alpha-ketoglutarate-dependent 2,4-dichlorophenoxyacetate dioxygenase
MGLTIEPVRDDFVAVVHGIDLRRRLSDAEVDALHRGMDEFAVLVFPDQPVDDEQQLAFSQQLGRLQPAVGNNVTPQSQRRLEASFSDVSNLDRESRIQERDDRGRLFGFGNRLWHSDASFREVPASYSILSARALPESGGTTQFADMRAAYDSLDEHTRQTLDGLVAVHSQMYSRSLLGFTEFTDQERQMFAPVRHTMVRTLPGNGRKSLYVGSHAGEIEGWPVPEARMFIFDLIEHATQPENVHVHRWTLHDVVMWDNRQVIHRVRRYDDLNEVRDMRRTTLMGDGPTL